MYYLFMDIQLNGEFWWIWLTPKQNQYGMKIKVKLRHLILDIFGRLKEQYPDIIVTMYNFDPEVLKKAK